MPISVIDAVKMGQWDFEPRQLEASQYKSTRAMPGSDEKLNVMAERLRRGLPLWHPSDRRCFDDRDDD